MVLRDERRERERNEQRIRSPHHSISILWYSNNRTTLQLFNITLAVWRLSRCATTKASINFNYYSTRGTGIKMKVKALPIFTEYQGDIINLKKNLKFNFKMIDILLTFLKLTKIKKPNSL